ncbi:metallophosphoesterase [Mucilaginibacter sp. JRF]|uniref:metallophosphoesterase n=1 Tax=Mucilaginibacter sp. JRF TaxID=2780088 RepID=UPI00188120C4|nr:metallophosphoesterase [Mucilaginibacter sp. JRF]MBE9584328.1 metallophosphoesterase [Mucilaginibacter sp. JRF]
MHRGGFFISFLIFAAISLLLDWYVFSGLRTLATGWQSRWSNLLARGYLVISIAVTLTFVLGITLTDTSRGLSQFHMWSLSVFLTFFVTKIVFVIVLSLGDLGRFVTGIASNAGKKGIEQSRPYFPQRRKFISEIAVLLAALPFSGFIYAMFKGKYDYRVHRHDVYFKDLPEAFNGFTITQLSDIHAGSFDNIDAVQKGIDKVIELNSDLFVFTGDLVNNVAEEIEPYIERFGKIRAKYGQYSVLGNHDYADYIQWDSEQAKAKNLETLKKHHHEMGFRLMLDENIPLEKNGQKINLVGVQNWGHGFVKVGDLDKALIGLNEDDFKVLLSHDPTHWEYVTRYHKNPVHLTLAGHTHGAQFGIEAPGFRWSPVKYRYLQWAGFAEQNDRKLYVNRGFGFLAFTGRLGIWPEITVLTLKRG